MTIRVMVVDDQALVRAGFSALLNSDPEIEVVGQAANGARAVEMAAATRPDVILMDIRMPEMDGLEAARRILAAKTDDAPKVLILTTFDLDEYVYDGLRAGASGFVLKDIEPADLLEAVRVIARGEGLLAPSITMRLISEFANRPLKPQVAPSQLKELTDREVEVLLLVARGMSNDEIAEHLVISPATSKTHVSHIMSKLGARDRAQLVVIAYESGLVR
jgi:DNA-binding NarL/FixJ family response regulator